jgi:uncharacterized membrane protein YidH (DUF202 family)
MDSELANDRTFLAWLRTGIALFGLGFVVAKVALIVQPDATRLENKNLYSAVGVLIVLSGAALVVVGYLPGTGGSCRCAKSRCRAPSCSTSPAAPVPSSRR